MAWSGTRKVNPVNTQEPAGEGTGGVGQEKVREVLGYAGPGTGRMQVIARFSDPFQARLAAAKLEAEGIACNTTDAITNVYALPDPAFLAVQVEDVQEAVEILAYTPARRFLTVPRWELPPVPVVTLPTCSACGSQEIGLVRRWGRVLAGCVVAFVWPAFAAMIWGMDWVVESCFLATGLSGIWSVICLKNRPMMCAKCGHRWREDSEREMREQKEQTE